MVGREFQRSNGSLKEIFAFVRGFFRDHGLVEDGAWNVDLVLEELFTNIVKYGRPSNEPIEVHLGYEAPFLTIRLRDRDSDFFDPTAVPDADTARPIVERSAGGLGLHFVRRMAERFEYTYEDRVSTITVSTRLES